MSTRLSILVLVLSAALCMGAGDPPGLEEPKIPTVDLSKLREEKSLWIGKEIRFTIQLDAELETWRAWVTRFGVEDYQAYSAWADSAFLVEARRLSEHDAAHLWPAWFASGAAAGPTRTLRAFRGSSGGSLHLLG